MSAFERLLVPGCTELPACQCGKEMQIASLERLPARSDAGIRVYSCRSCHHEMRLTVWATDDNQAARGRNKGDPVELAESQMRSDNNGWTTGTTGRLQRTG
jgi:hypothetical protein